MAALHGDHPGNLLADGRIEKALEQSHFEAGRNDLLENALRRRQELVHRLFVRCGSLLGVLRSRLSDARAAAAFRSMALVAMRTRTSCRPRPADRGVPATYSSRYRLASTSTSSNAGLSSKWVNVSSAAIPRNLKPRSPVCRRSRDELVAVPARVRCQRAAGRPLHVAVVAAAQPAIGGQSTSSVARSGLAAVSSSGWLTSRPAAGQVGHQLRDPLGVGRGRRRAVHGLFESRRGDQLHRPRDLADVADRLAAFVKFAGIGHGLGVFAGIGVVGVVRSRGC